MPVARLMTTGTGAPAGDLLRAAVPLRALLPVALLAVCAGITSGLRPRSVDKAAEEAGGVM